MSVFCFDEVPPDDVVDRCVEVYAAAFGQAPYFETPEQAEGLRERLANYRTRDGLLVAVARDTRGQTQGFALAVTAHPGDWWRDHAAAALNDVQRCRWFGEACLEVVHVAVHPDAWRRGYARALMATVESHTTVSTGVLSCHPQATGAQQFYLTEAWQVLTEEFRLQPGQLGYWLMVKDLAVTR